jgi:hypothetical protein
MAALVGRGAEQAELNRSWQAARGGEATVIAGVRLRAAEPE